MKNRYPGTCVDCGLRVLPGEGTAFKRPGARRFSVRHDDCDASESGADSGHSVYLGGPGTGQRTYYNPYGESFVNSRGRCEDAPCCGCCSC